MQQCRIIAVTQSWPVPKARDAWIDDSPPPIDHPPEPVVRAEAWFDARRDRSFMSEKLAGKLLGNQNQVHHIGIRYYHVVDQTVGMRHLQIVHGLEYDVVFNDNFSANSAPKLSLQRWTSLSIFSDNGPPRESPSPEADSRSSVEDSETESPTCPPSTPSCSIEEPPCGYSYQSSELLSVTASHGLLAMNSSSLEAIASLLYLSHQGTIGDNLQRCINSPAPNNRTLNSNPGTTTNSYLQSNTTTPSTSGQESWSTYPSEEALCPLLPQGITPYKPAESGHQAPRSEKNGHELDSQMSMSSAAIDSFSTSSGASSFVVSEDLCGGVGDSFKREKEEIQALSDSFVEQSSSISEFENHPGHKVWEWDVARQRWHKKGGTTDTDWFPEKFA